MTVRVLIVEDDPDMLEMLRRHLAGEGYAVTAANGGPAGLAAVERGEFDVVLSDLVMSGADGLAILEATKAHEPPPRVVLMTAFGSLETAIQAIRAGAYDYLTKPFKLDEASVAVGRAGEDRRLREENRRLRAEIDRRAGTEAILGRSKAMQVVFDQVAAMAASDATVMILGESGTGKELVARAIHRQSARRDRAFVPVNCAAIPENLLESELFGHEKGAFTGADRKRRGLFLEADGGTLFLDEVGDLPLPLQGKLLRALQERSIRPVGAQQDIRLDLRVMSATHRDLPRFVQEGKFREDLYYRLAVLPLRLPSLRERVDDILPLATHFLTRATAALKKELTGFDEESAAWLLRHAWPGNVRELENVVERAATLAPGPRVRLEDLHVDLVTPAPGGASRPTLASVELEYIQRVLAEAGGDKRAAARLLGVSVRTIQRKLK
ncbi:MAG TPA: sigma-54 dependent transcriptional regulator [Terriglobales bacterium]|nr:sigma-54 dependent transcriptional regulator [Terriglobales bacterium]